MKNPIIILVLILLSFSLPGQVNLDSIRNIWKDENQVDTVRLEAVNDILWMPYLFHDQPDSAFALSEAMYSFSQQVGSKKYESIALDNLAISMISKGNLKEVEELHNQSLELATSIDYARGIAESLLNLGVLQSYFLRDQDKAMEFASQALEIALENDDKATLAGTYALLAGIYGGQADNQKAEEYYKLALSLAHEVKTPSFEYATLGNFGVFYDQIGNSIKALELFIRALELARANGADHSAGHNLQSIGFLYYTLEDYQTAKDYTQQSVALIEKGSQTELAGFVISLAAVELELKEFEQAHENIQRTLNLAEEFGQEHYKNLAFALQAYALSEQGQFEKAEEAGKLANDGLEKSGDHYNLAYTQWVLGNLYNKMEQFGEAQIWCERALQISIELSDKASQRDNCKCLYEAYKGLKKIEQAFVFQERYTALEDSLSTDILSKKLQLMEFDKQRLADSLKVEEDKLKTQMAYEAEVQKRTHSRNIFIGIGILFLLLAGGLWSRLSHIRKSKATLQKEKDRSENLLLNILPAEVAEELKQNGKAAARDFEQVSILFTDFKEFTQKSEQLTAVELVHEINYCFEGFDRIVEKHGIEKIKTIGDAYMAASGLPVQNPDSAKNAVQAALEMSAFIQNRKQEREAEGKIGFEMRCGIHTGPVVAGIVGVKKYQYDLWGDTVNTASRMESNGMVGKLNISRNTFELIKDDPAFKFTNRGKTHVKGKGEMEMYFVERAG